METKIEVNVRMIRDWLKEGGGATTKAEALLADVLNGYYNIDRLREALIREDVKFLKGE